VPDVLALFQVMVDSCDGLCDSRLSVCGCRFLASPKARLEANYVGQVGAVESRKQFAGDERVLCLCIGRRNEAGQSLVMASGRAREQVERGLGQERPASLLRRRVQASKGAGVAGAVALASGPADWRSSDGAVPARRAIGRQHSLGIK
jgi:hypothetical protein